MASSTIIPEIKNLDVLLGKHFNQKLKILSQSSKMLTAPGENYGSTMLSLAITYEDEKSIQHELPLVGKLIPTNEMFREFFQVQITFIKELFVYTKIVPVLRQLEDELQILQDRASDLFCKCFGGRCNLQSEDGIVTEDAVLLLENLKINGYKNGDRLKGFDFETASLVLKKLARFHAEPIALRILKPDIYKTVIIDTLDVTPQPRPVKEELVEKYIHDLIQILIEGGQHHLESYANKMSNKMTKDLLESTVIASDDINNSFVTFGHSDFWVNNMMVHKDKNSLKIVDFQTSVLQSLVRDLLFFIYSSIKPDVLYENEDKFLKIYYSAFINCLKEFKLTNLEDYSWEAFNLELKDIGPKVVTQILYMYKIILMQRGDFSDINEVKEDDMFDLSRISDDCKFRMKKTFESFVRREWI